MNFNLFNSIILAGIIQGIIFALVIFSAKKYRHTATLLLGGLILAFSLNNLQYYLSDVKLITSTQLFTVLFIPWQLFTGPILLLYGRKFLYPERKIGRGTYWVFLPFVLGFSLVSYYKIMYHGGWLSPGLQAFCDVMLGVTEFFAILFDQIIVIWLLLQIRKIKKSERADFSVLKISPEIGWLQTVLLVFFLLSFLWLYITAMTFVVGAPQYLWYVIWIAISAMIYWLGHRGIYSFGIYQQRKKLRNYSIEHAMTPVYEKPKNEHVQAFEKLMINQKRFLDPELTLDKISEELGVSKSHLSRTINTELRTGFPDYINSLRVEEAKSYLLNPDFSNYTLVAIGLEAGFASKTTFNSTFKKIVGLTPSEFKKNSGTMSDAVIE